MNNTTFKYKVWWIPQVPMKPFEIYTNSLREAKKLLEVLADYDRFQFENRIKPDYCNAGGVMVQEDLGDVLEWVDWCDDETGDSIDTINFSDLKD